MAARRTHPDWRTFDDLPAPTPEQVELLGLSVMVTVMERMSPAERARSLKWLLDRYGPRVTLGGDDG